MRRLRGFLIFDLLLFLALPCASPGQQPHPRGASSLLRDDIIRGLAADRRDFCESQSGCECQQPKERDNQPCREKEESCEDVFRKNLRWRDLLLTRTGQKALLVENHNAGACNEADCRLFLFAHQNGYVTDLFGMSEGVMANFDRTRALEKMTNGYFDLEVMEDGNRTRYTWDGLRYYPVGNCKNSAKYPRFESHPAQPYLGKRAAPILKSRLDRLFRTRIRDAAKSGPNFAGHYAIAYWGCGTGCSGFVIVDVITGAVHDPDFPSHSIEFHYWTGFSMEDHPDWSDEDFEGWTCDIGSADTNGFLFYKVNSSLLAVEGCIGGVRCGRTFFVMRKGKLHQIFFEPDLFPDGTVARQ